MKTAFSTPILQWYAQNKRDLPWRHSPTPYHVLISEIMLQQTQVLRVKEKFKEFRAKFPTIQDLASASKAEVISTWSGMGYNRRALLLHRFAQVIVQEHNGTIPDTVAELLKLPGIGPYTAGAIASFAYNRPEPAVDVNVRRIYQRYFKGIDRGLPMGIADEKQLYALVKSTIPNHKSRDFHNALMDFGSLICTRDEPECNDCPLQKTCTFFPIFRKDKANALFHTKKRKEPGVNENGRFIPNRIFRGRIVEFTRRNDGKPVTVSALGMSIKSDYSAHDKDWLLSICAKLQHDGLIAYSLQGSTLHLFLAKD